MSKTKQKREEQILKGQDWSGLFKEYEKESDRSAALLITNALDVWLGELLRAFFIDRETFVDELLKPDKPLGSFASRIRIAFCLGLITENEHSDFHIIRDIRNRFAHELHGITFDEKSIAQKCRSLKGVKFPLTPDIEQPFSAREKFFSTGFVLAQHMQRASQRTKHCQIRPPGEWKETENRINEDGTIRVQTMSYKR